MRDNYLSLIKKLSLITILIGERFIKTLRRFKKMVMRDNDGDEGYVVRDVFLDTLF